MKWPAAYESDVDNCADRCRFDNRAERLITVYARLLRLAIGYETRLVAFEASICIEFMLI